MSSQPARIILPAILLANDLLDGDVVFWTGESWTLDPAGAAVAHDAAAAAALEAAAGRAVADNRVVDAYLVDVTIDADGLPTPNHLRERFKIRGPSHRPDLGKQAAFAHLSGSLRDVSL